MNFDRRPWTLGALVALVGLNGGVAWLSPPRDAGSGDGTVQLWRAAGSWRSAMADAAWLKMADAWERRDPGATRAWLGIAVQADPSALYFWINGARILAFDMAAWPGMDRIQAGGEALRWIDRATRAHPASAALWIERASVELNVLGDAAAAAESYRRAAEQPGAPYFAARLRAELLRQLGRKAEALEWLQRVYPTLPKNDPRAEAALVKKRIEALERELGTAR